MSREHERAHLEGEHFLQHALLLSLLDNSKENISVYCSLMSLIKDDYGISETDQS
jgi:hypothetical protein